MMELDANRLYVMRRLALRAQEQNTRPNLSGDEVLELLDRIDALQAKLDGVRDVADSYETTVNNLVNITGAGEVFRGTLQGVVEVLRDKLKED